MPRDRRRPSRGFTILEVAVLASIMGVVAALGIPSISAMRRPWVLTSATRQLVSDLDMARMRAIARRTRYRVSFAAGGYTLARETSPGVFVAEDRHVLPDGARLPSALASTPVIYDSRGMIAANVSIPVSVEGAGSRTVTVNVLGRTTIG